MDEATLFEAGFTADELPLVKLFFKFHSDEYDPENDYSPDNDDEELE